MRRRPRVAGMDPIAEFVVDGANYRGAAALRSCDPRLAFMLRTV